jgi:CBS domain-containing protein
VEEIMVPLAQYATVSENTTLLEAVQRLEEAQKAFDRERYRHRAVLVLNNEGRLVGKLSQHDVIRALEPNYRRVNRLASVGRFGWSQEYLESIARQHRLWSTPLEGLCTSSAGLRVREIMHSPEEGEYIEKVAPITKALHHLVMGSHNSLLVIDSEREIVGVLRLTDVFALVCQTLQKCSSKKAIEQNENGSESS